MEGKGGREEGRKYGLGWTGHHLISQRRIRQRKQSLFLEQFCLTSLSLPLVIFIGEHFNISQIPGRETIFSSEIQNSQPFSFKV